MNYKETTDYLFACLPMFQRIGGAAYKADLQTTEALMTILDHPEHRFLSVHVAGTNGKGSCSHSLAAVFQAAGYKTGLYTSPHLIDFRERIRINGEPVTETFVVDFVEENREAFDLLKPSFFEMTVAMAFDYFAKEHVDIAIVEVGMGGRLDSTNVLMPELSVITNIGIDHTEFLGKTRSLIAEEKAGIIKLKTPVIIGETHEETQDVFREKALLYRAPLLFADQHYTLKNIRRDKLKLCVDVYLKGQLHFQDLDFELLGFYQERNLCTIIAALDVLRPRFKLSEMAIREGLSNVCQSSGLMGRWQRFGEAPLRICDTGHNADGLTMVVNQLQHTPKQTLHMVIGMVSDKDIHANLSILPTSARYYFCKAFLPRALDSDRLREQAEALGLIGQSFPDVEQAYRHALAQAKPEDMIFVGGSTFVVADLLACL